MKILDFRVRPRVEWFYRELVPDPIPAFKRYVTLYSAEERLSLTGWDASIAEMRAAGVTQGVIFAGDAAGNEHVFEALAAHPETYVGLAGVRADLGVTQAVKALERAYATPGISGLNLSPFMTGVYATDARNYPLYALSEDRGKCVLIHASAHYNPGQPLDLGDPMQVDRLAVHFPHLKLVIAHGGYGFGDLGATIANRHDNVYIDWSGIHPRHLPPTTLGWINGPLAKKSLFGTNYPCLPYDIVEAWRERIKPANQPDFFYQNAARLLGLEST